jgi:hypothetical protein
MDAQVEHPLLCACSSSAALIAAGSQTHVHHIKCLQRSCISHSTFMYTLRERRIRLFLESESKKKKSGFTKS